MIECVPTQIENAESWISFISSFRQDGLTVFFQFISDFLTFSVLFPVLMVGYWFVNKEFFHRTSLLLTFSIIINLYVKGIFAECRPFTTTHLEAATGYSFPSGHAQTAAVLYGSFARALASKWAKFAFLIIILLTCLSRNYLAVHYVHDVIIGALLGGLIIYVPWPTKWLKQKPIILQLLGVLIALLAWSYFINATSDRIWRFTGLFYGFWAGGLLEQQYVNFKSRFTKHSIWQFTLGFLGYICLSQINLMLSNTSYGNLPIIYFLGYGLLTFWIAFIAPWIFNKILEKFRINIYTKSLEAN